MVLVMVVRVCVFNLARLVKIMEGHCKLCVRYEDFIMCLTKSLFLYFAHLLFLLVLSLSIVSLFEPNIK